MVINTNLPALSSARLLSISSAQLGKSLQRLSSGSRLVSPEDDAAGMAVSMNLTSQVNRISAAKSNLQNAVSYSQTQDGFLQKIGDALDRMSQLALMAQDNTKSPTDILDYKAEFDKLAAYVNDLAGKSFNEVPLFDNTPLTVTTDSEGATVPLSAVDGTAFDVSGEDISTDAPGALTAIKGVLITLATDRANMGANISVLNSYTDQLGVLSDNLSAANSRIKDVDVATESANYAKYNILVQAGTAMLAQANQAPQSVLKLLQ